MVQAKLTYKMQTQLIQAQYKRRIESIDQLYPIKARVLDIKTMDSVRGLDLSSYTCTPTLSSNSHTTTRLGNHQTTLKQMPDQKTTSTASPSAYEPNDNTVGVFEETMVWPDGNVSYLVLPQLLNKPGFHTCVYLWRIKSQSFRSPKRLQVEWKKICTERGCITWWCTFYLCGETREWVAAL
jgi:hypothetical protein